MSRCFPFPPPGYEKKSRTDDVDLLKKERHREKKHKKEKKDKAKKESKEKGEKEGRDGKHKDKKDKKERKKEKKKDKDKDKDKDKGKDKSKISAANEKGFPTQAQGLNGINLHQKEIKQNDTKDILFDDRLTKQYASNNGEMARANNHLVEENKDSKFRMELDRRIRDNDGRAGNQLVQKFTIADCRKDEGTVRVVAKSSSTGTGTWPDGKEKFQGKGVDATKIDGREIWAEAQPIGNAAVQNHAGNCYPRVNEKPRPLEKIFVKTLEGTVEGTERVKEKKDDRRGDKKKDDKRGDKKKDDKRGDKRKGNEKEKKGHGKDKDRDKKKKKEDKAKEKIEHRNGEQNKLKESNKAGLIGLNSSAQVSKHSHENSIIGENLNKQKEIDSNGVLHGEYHNKNLNKRKEIDSNGFLHANESRPSKLPRPSSSHPFTENGRILEPCQISLQNASDGPVAATNVKVENMERKTNGIIEAPTPAVSPKKIPTAPKPADPVTKISTTKISTKPPHPDTKYISEVYSVPKANEWSDFDDQEWLFGSNHSQERKPLVKSSEVVDTLQVWAEVVHIEPADVFALPYVIPY
uniref:Myb-like protein X isoform X2 n=1 Tax=Cicer arietinum TaxID=3827 RepID=A0A3Q7Y0Y1_CICAR|nr:myb-like protein X isoform X2 [Cicer arietinum]